MNIDFQESVIFYFIPGLIYFSNWFYHIPPRFSLTRFGSLILPLIIILMSISTFFSINIGISYYAFWTFFTTLLTTLIFIVFYADKKYLHFFLELLVNTSLVYAAIFIVNRLGWLPIEPKDFGDNFIVQIWGHSHLANLLIFPIIYQIFQINQKYSAAALFKLLVLFLVLSLSLSRASVLSLIIVLPLIKFNSPRTKLLTLTGLILVLSIFFLYSHYYPRSRKDLTGSRPDYLSQSLVAIRRSPIVGNGPSTFNIFNARLRQSHQSGSITAHSSLLDFSVSYGLVFTFIFFTLIITALYHRYHQNYLLFNLGLAGLLCSLFDASWNNPGLLTLSLIFIFSGFRSIFSSAPNKKNYTLAVLSGLLLIFYFSKTTSDFLFFYKKYELSLKFDPFNLNSRLANINYDLPTTLRLFPNEQQIFEKLSSQRPLPQNLDYHLKLFQLNPNSQLSTLINLLNHSPIQPGLIVSLEPYINSLTPATIPYWQKIQLAKNFYLIGLDYWHQNLPNSALIYFQKAVDFADGYSHFYIELAAAYHYLGYDQSAQNIIRDCLKIPASVNHCSQFSAIQNLINVGDYQPTISSL